MEIVPKDISQAELKQEVDMRSSRAGLTTRSGGPIPLKTKITSLSDRGRENYSRIFGHD